MSRNITLFLLLLLCVPSFVGARTLNDDYVDSVSRSNKLVFIDGRPVDRVELNLYTDSIRSRIAAFYYDQFHHFMDPGAPYFLFLSKDSKLAMGIGGAVRMRAYYDWGGAMPSPGFAPALIPIPADPANMKHFGTTPAGTCLFFRVLGQNKTLGEYQLYIEADFTGYQSRDFRLKKAYAIINDFTVGYAPSTFSDPAAVPPTVDAQGPANKMTPTSVLVRYMPVVKDKWYFAVSAETPETSIGADGSDTRTVSNWLPDFAAFAQYQWAQGQHIRLSGIVRTLSYRDMLQGRNHDKAGWAVQLSGVGSPHRAMTVFATANYGHGYASLGGDLMMGAYDLVGDPSLPGRLYAPASYGWCLGFKYNFTPMLFASLSVSQTRYLPSHRVSPDEYKYGMASAVNVFWNMTPRMQVGAEYDFGYRRNFGGAHRSARRVGAMCMFSF
ncbi:MAG: hypothetical protein K1W01_12890 [Muribaculaceae bacterium]